ncbi:MAG: helix-turn-helix transcriptional regulator [Mogibacterium sp.]|nr:helix-turn-helix transcriptional regulator [Mogibacterium sp.]
MDLVKIGKYIAEKRKNVGYSQEQLGEKLGISGKAVSKWECGKSMPDVSKFNEISELLGISINELIAGKDLSDDKVVTQSERNITSVIENYVRRIRSSKAIIITLILIIVALTGYLLTVAYRNGDFIQNYIEGFDENSPEMQIAKFVDTDFVFNKYVVRDKVSKITVAEHIYKNGELYKEGDIPVSPDLYGISSNKEHSGMVGLSWDQMHHEITTVVSDGKRSTKYSRDISIIIGADFFENGAAVVGPENLKERTEINMGEPTAVMAISFDKDGKCAGCGTLSSYMQDPIKFLKDNDWTFIYTIQFD